MKGGRPICEMFLSSNAIPWLANNSQLCVSHAGQTGILIGEPSTLGEVQLAEGFLDTFALLLR